nr:MAG TPA: hypothetical protein [Bacteriophage sp.]
MPFLLKTECFSKLCNTFAGGDSIMLWFDSVYCTCNHYILCFHFVK